MYDIIIIGAGTAGLTAAIYARRAEKSVLVLEESTYGGQIINTHKIENYPAAPHISGVEFANKLYAQAGELGAEIKFEKVEEVEKSGKGYKIKTSEDSYTGKTLIIATGSAEKHLNLKNEETLIGHGLSYCATCDGHFFKDQDVAVNGGGNTAFWDALYLSGVAKTVTIIHHRDAFRADEALVKKVKDKKNVKFVLNASISELVPDGNNLAALKLDNDKTIDVKALFVAIGRKPNTATFKDLVDLDNKGYIKSDESCKTSTEGVFVAGDVRDKPLHQLVTATADGATAATAAVNYINERSKNV